MQRVARKQLIGPTRAESSIQQPRPLQPVVGLGDLALVEFVPLKFSKPSALGAGLAGSEARAERGERG
jgi:hypothetical protein